MVQVLNDELVLHDCLFRALHFCFHFFRIFRLLHAFSGSHVISPELEKLLNHVRVLWLPANCTSMIQPLDQGIIHALKARYRRCLLRHIIASIDLHQVCLLAFSCSHALSLLFLMSCALFFSCMCLS